MCRNVLAVLLAAVIVLLASAAAASAEMRRGALAYRHGAERPRLDYQVFWAAVDESTVKTTKVMVRVTNHERAGSSRNWASITVFVGGVHPGMGEAPWDGRGDWSAIDPGAAGLKSAAQAGDPRVRGTVAATVVWSCELYLGSGAWKTRSVPTDQRRSDRYDTWIRVRFHAPGRDQYWFRVTSPLG